jgi:hypothetical protein
MVELDSKQIPMVIPRDLEIPTAKEEYTVF